VVDTFVGRRVALFTQRHAHAAVGADVEADVDLALAVAGHNHQVFTHGPHHVIIGIGNLGLVTQQVPAHAEQVFQFPLVQLFVIHHRQRDLPGLPHDQIVQRLAIGQAAYAFCCDVHGVTSRVNAKYVGEPGTGKGLCQVQLQDW